MTKKTMTVLLAERYSQLRISFHVFDTCLRTHVPSRALTFCRRNFSYPVLRGACQ
ncbi:hypothetical protein SXCC_01997 [Gluconacetobacter sp. SXCC-1]|nr:hypothetical protein SXCC_01997 [Gluconacetobacter sp. SXCC-1]